MGGLLLYYGKYFYPPLRLALRPQVFEAVVVHILKRRFDAEPEAHLFRGLVGVHPEAGERPAAARGGFAQKFRLHRHVDDVGHDVPRLKQLGVEEYFVDVRIHADFGRVDYHIVLLQRRTR